MLFVLFQVGNDRYALDASLVIEVIPLVTIKQLPQAPKGVVGLFVYRGRPVPAIDLGELLVGRPARERLSTRIIVVNCSSVPRGRDDQLLGLIAERATSTMRGEAKAFRDVGLHLPATPYLGPVLTDQNGVIQLVHAQKLLDATARVSLLAPTVETGHVAH